MLGGVTPNLAWAAPWAATTANPASSVYAYAWTSYVSTLNSDGVPASWWRLNESSGATTAAAAKGSITGTYEGSPTLGASGAIVGSSNKAMTFVANQKVNFGDNYDFAGKLPFSVEFWFKVPSSTDEYESIVRKIDTTGAGNGWNVMFVVSQQKMWFVRSGKVAGVDASSYAMSGTALTPSGWNHVVATYDGTESTIYINGSHGNVSTTNPSITDHAVNLYIGSPNSAGSIDELSIYTSALTARQVRAHYYAGLAGF